MIVTLAWWIKHKWAKMPKKWLQVEIYFMKMCFFKENSCRYFLFARTILTLFLSFESKCSLKVPCRVFFSCKQTKKNLFSSSVIHQNSLCVALRSSKHITATNCWCAEQRETSCRMLSVLLFYQWGPII